jgi:hypothetical protein
MPASHDHSRLSGLKEASACVYEPEWAALWSASSTRA